MNKIALLYKKVVKLSLTPLSTRLFYLAMLTILLLGFLFLWQLSWLLNPKTTKELLRQGTITQAPVSLTLSLANPDDNLLVFTPDLLLQGKTSANAIILLTLDTKDQLFKADSDGNFSTTLILEGGVNQLTVAVFDEYGNSKLDSRTIYYSTEKI